MKIFPLLLLLSCAPALAIDTPAPTLGTASLTRCPQSVWPSEKAGQIAPGVAQLRVYADAQGKVVQAAIAQPGANPALDRAAHPAVLGCTIDTALLTQGAGWYKLRYVWGLQPSIKGVEREAIRELMDEAVNGDAESQAVMWMQSRPSRRFIEDVPDALAWLVRSAQGGWADAQLQLAINYANGEHVAEDQARATFWYGRAAQAGNATAQFLYGVQLEFGLGAPADPAAAMSWYRKAAAGGSADAKKRLAKTAP